MPPLTCTHGNWLNSRRGVIDVIIGLVFVVLARFLATDVVTLLCNTAVGHVWILLFACWCTWSVQRFLPTRSLSGVSLGEKLGGQIAFAKVRQHDDDQFSAVLRPIGDLNRRPGRCSATDAAHEAFQASELPGCLEGVFIGHGHDFVDDLQVQDVGDESRPNSLNRVLARLQRLAGAGAE